MENYFYLAVRIAAVIYILYKILMLLFKFRFSGLRNRIQQNELKEAVKEMVNADEEIPENSVLGRTNKILLDDPKKVGPQPVVSTDLESTGFISQDLLIIADDVEAPEQPFIPVEEELYEDAPPPDDNAMSTGLAFEQLTDAVDVLKKGTTDELRRTKAAEAIYNVQGTEILDFITREVCSADSINNLLKDCLDGDGFPLKKRNPVDGFDIGKYV